MRASFILFVILAAGLPAQIKVMTSGGFAAPLQDVLPEFEKTTGITVTIGRGQSQGTTPNTIGAQLRRGEPADVVILSKEGLNGLIEEGQVVQGTGVDLAQTPLGVSVRSGAPKPDLSSIEAFKQALLRAKSITFPSSTTGIYMTTKLFPLLGIAKEVAEKTTNEGVGAVIRGDAEMAIQPVSELLHLPGTDFAGPIPKEIQFISVFSAAVAAGSKKPAMAAKLIEFLSSGRCRDAIKDHGMEPLPAR